MLGKVRTLATIILFFTILLLCPVGARAVETYVKDFGLGPPIGSVDTGIDLLIGDVINFASVTPTATISIYGSSRRWMGTVGDSNCRAGDDYTLPGANCWSLVARIGNGSPFSAAIAVEGSQKTVYVLNPGRLYLGINKAPGLLAGYGGWIIRIIKNYNPPPPPPTPFLDLPWDYQSEGISFSNASLAINSFFDHEYPLLSTNLSEPEDTGSSVVTFRGDKTVPGIYYTKHDGYDYGKDARATINTPVLAAAAGCASYHYDGKTIGNAVFIDHSNHFQTRYYHLQPNDLITTAPTGCVQVTQGQQIGLVGSTGNSTAAHIHFMVIQDKNGDGNFGDNIPDGITDPFGWQSLEPDPWEHYQFNYLGAERIGNKSYYLWQHPIPNLDENLTSNQKYFEFENAKLEFPANSVVEPTQLHLLKAAWFKISDTVDSVSSSLRITANNLFGTPVTSFLQPFTLTFDFSDVDLSRFNPDTLKIYSSEDGNSWQPEDTLLELQTQTASAQINHLTHFTLAGELWDTAPPVTTITANINPITDNTFAQPITLSLIATDQPASNSAGIDYTLYKLADGDWQQYTQPIEFADDGDYSIQYYSVDLGEHSEDIQTYNFTINSSLAFTPELILAIDPDTLQPQLIASPSGQINTTPTDSGLEIIANNGSRTLTATAKARQFGHSSSFSFLTLTYNDDPLLTPDFNKLDSYHLLGREGAIRTFTQVLRLDRQVVFLGYSNRSNKTLILSFKHFWHFQHQIYSGLYTLQLATNQGKLKYQPIPAP